jgi:hypothetical protein
MKMSDGWETFLVALSRGEPLTCTSEQWHGGLRSAVQRYAGRMIDMHQDVYAIIALEEVRQNDIRWGFPSPLPVTHTEEED